MKLRHVRALTVAVAFLNPVLVSGANAQGTPAGVYRSRSVSLELASDGRAAIFGANGPLAIGTFRVRADTMVLRDDSGPGACRGTAGVYVWDLTGDTLRLHVVTDTCDMRRAAFAMPWVRVATSMQPAPQQLQAIMITAERQSQDVQRTPLAITALAPQLMQDAGVTRAQDLTTVVPGLLIGAMNGGSALMFVRGVGNLAATSNQDPTVTFNYDGVYIARPTSTSGLFYDLERVEVLKGPQGTLYGRNATGGAVNILPRRPELQTRAAELAASFGSLGTGLVEGWLNAPLGDRVAVRVAGQRARHDAYLKDGSDDQDDWGGRVQVRFEASDAFTLRAGVDYSDQGGLGTGATPLALGANRFGIASPEASAYYETRRVFIAGRNWSPTTSMRRWNDQRHRGVNATVDWRSAFGTLTVVPASRVSDVDASTTAVGNEYSFREHDRQTSLEARLASEPWSGIRTLVGAFYFDEDINHSSRPFNQFHFILQRFEQATTSTAQFGRVTWDVAENFRTTVGARYTREQRALAGSFESFLKICPPPPTASCPNSQPFPADIMSPPLTFHPDSSVTQVFNPANGTLTRGNRGTADLAKTYSRLTWRGAAEFDLTPSALVYGSYETGFKSGGFFFSNDNPEFEPEHVGAFTLGLKSRLLGYRLRANIELFDWQYRDQQISKISLDSRMIQHIRTENIGQASIRGMETEIEYALGARSQLSAGVQYLDATYDEYTFETNTRQITGCDQAQPDSTRFLVDCSGRRAPYAPRWTVSLGAGHSVVLPTGASLSGRLRSRYQSRTMVGLDFLENQRQDGHWLADATLTFMTADDRYTLGVFGRNITDQTVVSNTFVVPLSTFRPGESPFTVGVMRPPRTVGIRMSARF